jgi:hypothetical protein
MNLFIRGEHHNFPLPPTLKTKLSKGFAMSFFSKILEKLGLGKDKDKEQAPSTAHTSAPVAGPPKPAASAPAAKPGATATKPAAHAPAAGVRPDNVMGKETGSGAVKSTSAAQAPAAPKPMSAVDVTTMLEQKAKGTGLNWKQSISDLLFLLDLDNSREARTELAKELGAPADVMTDSARMNTWLHKEVLRKIAENGGNIPQDLLD